MKTYKVKPEYHSYWGSIVDDDTIITHDEVAILAREWDKNLDELIENQLIEIKE